MRPVSALITGTSTEFLGRRPLPRLARERAVVFVVGPDGSGKSSVAWRLAGATAVHLDNRGVQDALVHQVRYLGWARELLTAPVLILDGPVWLRNRPGAVTALTCLLNQRADLGNRTLVCQSDRDGSFDELLPGLQPGRVVILGLRLPVGRRGRMRFARRMCDRLGIPRSVAKGTAGIDPWTYARVIEYLRRQPALPFEE